MVNNPNLDPTKFDLAGPASKTDPLPGQKPADPAGEGPATRIDQTPSPMIFGDYELVHEIARGGMGVVWKARQRSLDRSVALKMILEGRLTSDDAVQRFLTEARAAASLDHPNIVPVYERGRVGDRCYFSMAFVEGKTLWELIAKRGPLPIHEAAAVVRAVADAIGYAHSHSIIHRDLKPSNVLVDIQGRPRVTDFGLAKCLSEVGGLTAAGQVLGTPAFMAPEQALGRNQEVGPRADVYALGGILYFLLTGDAPFDGDSAASVLHQVAYEAPLSPRKRRPEVPAELETICLRCLEKDPVLRYGTAAEVIEALTPWCTPPAEKALVAAPTSPTINTTLATPPPARRWLPTVVIGVAVVAVTMGGVWFAKQRWGGQDEQVGGGPPVSSGGQPGTSSPVVLPVGAVDLDPKFHEFPLRVEMVGAKRGAEGIDQLLDGQAVQFRIEVDREAYVGIWNLAPDGVLRQLFPNEYEADHRITGGKPRLVPDPTLDYEIGAKAVGGVDLVFVAALTARWSPIEGEKEGPFAVFKKKDNQAKWQGLQHTLRDLELRPKQPKSDKAPLLSEELLRYRVEPAKK